MVIIIVITVDLVGLVVAIVVVIVIVVVVVIRAPLAVGRHPPRLRLPECILGHEDLSIGGLDQLVCAEELLVLDQQVRPVARSSIDGDLHHVAAVEGCSEHLL